VTKKEKWMKQEVDRCKEMGNEGEVMSTSERRTAGREGGWKEEVIDWTLCKRKEALLGEIRKVEEELLRKKFRERARIKELGETYTPWATHTWRQGKKVQRREEDIRVVKSKGEMWKWKEYIRQYMMNNNDKRLPEQASKVHRRPGGVVSDMRSGRGRRD